MSQLGRGESDSIQKRRNIRMGAMPISAVVALTNVLRSLILVSGFLGHMVLPVVFYKICFAVFEGTFLCATVLLSVHLRDESKIFSAPTRNMLPARRRFKATMYIKLILVVLIGGDVGCGLGLVFYEGAGLHRIYQIAIKNRDLNLLLG